MFDGQQKNTSLKYSSQVLSFRRLELFVKDSVGVRLRC